MNCAALSRMVFVTKWFIHRRRGNHLIAWIEGDVAGESRAREWEWRLRD
jgi:hypothetical protein